MNVFTGRGLSNVGCLVVLVVGLLGLLYVSHFIMYFVFACLCHSFSVLPILLQCMHPRRNPLHVAGLELEVSMLQDKFLASPITFTVRNR